ncbi:MAG TPA: AI-2E family transporter [Candidatus Binatia bacterium]
MPTAPWSAFLRPFRPALYLAAIALVVAVLARGQAVIVPLATAAMLSFVLTPPVAVLERWGVPRFASVVVVVSLVIGLVAGFGFVLTRQISELATNMPRYSTSVRAKLAALRETEKSPLTDVQASIDRLSHELDAQERKTGEVPAATTTREPAPVTVVPSEPTDVERVRGIVEPVIAPLTYVGIVLILLLFMLMDREDLRDRVIRLTGPDNVTLTTRAMDEAGMRIGRFLFTQSVINVGFGACVALGLLLIGIPYAILWGVTAALLRFIPYLGSAIAMIIPVALAFLQSHGWAPTLETIALFVGLDVVTANVIEPLVIGSHTGVSSLALLVSALFWTWLWGPIGLLLATPLTVCLAVIGKHVPGLDVLAVVLGDEPPLAASTNFYQRLLAGDEDEAEEIVAAKLGEGERVDVFDDVVVPMMVTASRDRLRDEISESEYQNVLATTAAIVANHAAADGAAADTASAQRILAVPARSAADELALEMLDQTVTAGGKWTVERLSASTLASEAVEAVERGTPDVIVIVSTPPGGLAHARYLAKRIRQRFPDARISIFRPGGDAVPPDQELSIVGADRITTRFAALCADLPYLLVAPAAAAPPAALPSAAAS